MRDVDKSSSNHHSSHHHHHGKSGGGAGNSKALTSIPEIRAETNNALALLDKIVNDVATARWSLTSVNKSLDELEAKPVKCPNCDKVSSGGGGGGSSSRKESSGGGGSSPSKERKDKKAKKAVLPMVSGHTVQRPNISIVRVDDQRSRDRGGESSSRGGGGGDHHSSSSRPGPSSSKGPSNKVSSSSVKGGGGRGGRTSRDDDDDQNSTSRGRKRRVTSRSRSRDKPDKRKRAVSSSSSSSSGSSSSSSSSSKSRSRSRSPPLNNNNSKNKRGGGGGSSGAGGVERRKSANTRKSDDDELLSVGGSDLASSTRNKPKPSTSSSSTKPGGTVSSVPQHKKPPVSTTSSHSSSHAASNKKPSGSKVSGGSPVHPHGSASSRFLSSAQNLDALKRKHKIKECHVNVTQVSKLLKYGQTSVNLNELDEKEVQKFVKDWKKKVIIPKPVLVPKKEVTPPKRMIGPKSKMAGIKAKMEQDKKLEGGGKHNPTTAEMLRAKLREKFNKFKIERASKGSSVKSEQALPDSTTNSSSNASSSKGPSTATRSELAAIGLSVYVKADNAPNESLDEVVGKGLDGSSSSRSELLEMKRDDWIMIQNNRTGVGSLKDHVQAAIKDLVGGDYVPFEGETGNDQYTVGNYYIISKEGHPLQLMRYVGKNTMLPPCADEDDSHPPGFVPLDLSSLTNSQISQLQSLAGTMSVRGRTVRASRSFDDDEEEEGGSDDELVAVKKEPELEEPDDEVPIDIPPVNFDSDDDTD